MRKCGNPTVGVPELQLFLLYKLPYLAKDCLGSEASRRRVTNVFVFSEHDAPLPKLT